MACVSATSFATSGRVLHYLRKKDVLSPSEVEKMLAKENSGFSLDGSVQISSWDRCGLERLLRYCCRPSFASENIRWNGKKVTYNLSKPNILGQTSIQLDPIEFIDRIATLIPIPHRHRRHYFGVFAPNFPLRKHVVANAKRHPENFIPPPLQSQAEKVRKVSLEWAALIARIYEVNPLICSKCGGKIKIIGFVTHHAEILRVLCGIGWPVQSHNFDPPENFHEWHVNQLLSNTVDGFPEMENQESYWREEDPFIQKKTNTFPLERYGENNSDPPHWHLYESYCDPPHLQGDYIDPPHE